ncbi:hypothetical protein D3C83_13670 [compost metagenome]
MPAGVVDGLEVVEIHEHEGVLASLVAGGFDQLAQPPFEFPPIHQAGQRIVARLPDQLLRHGADLADIVKHDDHAEQLAAARIDRRTREANRALAPAAAHQPH